MGQVRGPRDEASPRRDVAHLLGSDREHELVLARGDRHRAGADRLHARAAERRHARDRPRGEVERLGHRGAGVAEQGRGQRLGGAEPRGFEVVLLDPGVGDRAARGLREQLEVAAAVEHSEPRRGRPDDRHLSGYRHGDTFQKYWTRPPPACSRRGTSRTCWPISTSSPAATWP